MKIKKKSNIPIDAQHKTVMVLNTIFKLVILWPDLGVLRLRKKNISHKRFLIKKNPLPITTSCH